MKALPPEEGIETFVAREGVELGEVKALPPEEGIETPITYQNKSDEIGEGTAPRRGD